jgi:Staphylococcal nuclease homologue
MSSLLLVLAGALSFQCSNPSHHDGDNITCSNIEQSIRLQGIDAPEMPGACRPGRACTPGDPYAARDQLRRLTRGRDLRCEQEDTDDYGRIIARCSADGVDLSCAMIASGQAVPRYAALACAGSPPARALPAAAAAPTTPVPLDTGPVVIATPSSSGSGVLIGLLAGFVWLALVNGALWIYICRFWRGEDETWLKTRPLDTRVFLGLAAVGGSPAALAGIWLRDPGDQQEPLEQPMIIIIGLQLGLLLGGLLLLLW